MVSGEENLILSITLYIFFTLEIIQKLIENSIFVSFSLRHPPSIHEPSKIPAMILKKFIDYVVIP